MNDEVAAVKSSKTKQRQEYNVIVGADFNENVPEMVGLIPKWRAPDGVKSTEHVTALGIFSRGQVKDDLMGSLRISIEAHYGKIQIWLGRGIRRKVWKVSGFAPNPTPERFDVFEVKGLAAAPGLPEQSVMKLLPRIYKYARKENRIVLVPKQELHKEGKDLTDYYVRLGFEKVEMQDGSYELVYMGQRSSRQDEQLQQLMIRMNLWSGA